jgi:outer membrane immunogenic protein
MKVASFPLVALIASAALSGAAQAQNFDGPFVGAQAGWVQNKVENPTTGLGTAPIDQSKDSVFLGGYAGYDKKFGKIVLGTELGLGIGTSDTVRSGTISVDPKRSFDWTARAGYLVTPETLVYARGGYANERVRTALTTAAGPQADSEDRDGWLLGGGVERKLTSNLSARLEYRYADLSDGDGTYDRHQVLTGITFRF